MERYIYHFQPSCLVYILWHSVEVEELNFSLEELPSFSSILSQKVFVEHLLQFFFFTNMKKFRKIMSNYLKKFHYHHVVYFLLLMAGTYSKVYGTENIIGHLQVVNSC